MTAVAIRTVVNVPRHAVVVGIRLRFLVAVRARKHQIVARIRMAARAHTVGVAVIHGEPRVIERGSQPAGRVMARRAGCRKAGRNMVRAGRAVVVGLVTRIAIGWNRRVVIVDVALRARHLGMKASQGKGRVVVIETRRNPSRRVMAHIALLWEP